MTIALFEARALTPLVNFLERNGFRAAKLLDQQRIPVELVRNGRPRLPLKEIVSRQHRLAT